MKNLIFSVIILTALMSCQHKDYAKYTSRSKNISHGLPIICDMDMKKTLDSMVFSEEGDFYPEELCYSILAHNKVKFATGIFTIIELGEGQGFDYLLVGEDYDLLIVKHVWSPDMVSICKWKHKKFIITHYFDN